MKRHLFLFIVMVVITVAARAVTFTVDDIIYQVKTEPADGKNGTVSLHMCNSQAAEVVIPSEITYQGDIYTVDELSPNSIGLLTGNNTLVSLVIPNTVKTINSNAIVDCDALETIEVRLVDETNETHFSQDAVSGCDALKEISFNGCYVESGIISSCDALTKATFSSSTIIKFDLPSIKEVTVRSGSIGSMAFLRAAELETVSIGESGDDAKSVTIGVSAFSNCEKLSSLTLGSSVSEIGGCAFMSCSRLTTVHVPAASLGELIFGGCISLKSVSFDDGVTAVSNGMFSGCEALESVTFGDGLVSIGAAAFYHCALNEVKIPSKVTTLGESAFANNAFSEITLPASVKEIGSSALAGSSQLKSISVDDANENYASVDGVLYNKDMTELIQYPGGREGEYVIPSGITSINDYAFASNSNITSMVIPSSVNHVGTYVFFRCSNLAEMSIPDNLTSIPDGMFSMCEALKTFEIPSTVTSIGASAFYGCGIENIDIPQSVTEIGKSAFSGAGLKSVTISANVDILPSSIFRECWFLSEVSILSDVKSLGDYAFRGCTLLTSVKLPSAMTTIGEDAFNGCQSLKTIYCYAETPPMLTDNLTGVPADAIMYVPKGTLEAYKSKWSETPITDFREMDMTGIEEIADSEAFDLEKLDGAEVYTLGGVKVSTPADQLQHGVYIIRNRGKVAKIVL